MLSAQLWPWVTVIVSSLFLSSFTVFPGHTLHSLLCFSTPDCSPDARLMCPTAYFMFRRHPYLMSKTELPVSWQTSISCGLSISVSGSSVFAVAQARLLGRPLSLTSIPPTSHAGSPSHGVQNPVPSHHLCCSCLFRVIILSLQGYYSKSLSPHIHPCPLGCLVFCVRVTRVNVRSFPHSSRCCYEAIL